MSHVNDMRNESLVRHIFSHEEENAILNIVLGSSNNQDRLVWHYSPDGDYSTKSGYKIVRDCLSVSAESTEVDAIDHGFSFKFIWDLCIPPKVRYFLWRTTTNSLSTSSNLVKGSILVSDICPIYETIEEDIVHVLFNCSVASG